MSNRQSVNADDQKQNFVLGTGKEKIKRMMSMGKPKQAIKEFSGENGLDIPAAKTIYALLDSLGHTRRSIHDAVLEAAVLSAQGYIQRETLPQDKHLALLAQIKHYLGIPRLQHLPLLLLTKQPTLVPKDIREAICTIPGLYEKCSISIKREVWRHDYALFKEYMLPLICNYVKSSDMCRMSREISGTQVKVYSRRRRAHAELVRITGAIDADLQLYMQTLGMVREKFLETNDPVFGTLRLDLVMAMHESDVEVITNTDPCHGLAWSLDACIMKQTMDDRRVLEIQRYFDGIVDPDQAPYGEIALILNSPYSRHILAQYILSILEDIAPNAEVSTKYADLAWPSLMLTIGLSAHKLLSLENLKIPKVDRTVTRGFFRSLIPFIQSSQKHDRKMAALTQQQLHGGSSKRSRLSRLGAFSSSTPVFSEENGNPPALDDISILSTSELARQVLYVFLLKRILQFDFGMLNKWLPVIGNAFQTSLELPNERLDEGSLTSQQLSQTNPEPSPISLSLQPIAFEADAFIQSLTSHIKETNGFATAILNSIGQTMDSNEEGAVTKAIEAVPLLKLFDQEARARHCAHEQAVAFLTDCADSLAAEYSSTSGSGHSASESANNTSVPADITINNKENAIYFIFAFAEHAAATYVVDPSYSEKLSEQYNRLAAACPPQAFKYRISSTNCPNASRFLKKSTL
ncbi:hypothetical protein GGI25_000671 [Coemansia spiralis]|uniref:Uncharacterized protein n=2 Tax=Coemansia TaxID=4863 RepID=A0A9W8G6Y1_9FUNG|nr:hypothetical protein EDC05_000626 [Coemansia umbellata]KAJ2623703.1 hypothetical protein GGI26_002150 [Coemansia sp. RSA 1358]KAJ2680379.1 hypothetical protein GGI25_000671 [Coemansia spiralis]